MSEPKTGEFEIGEELRIMDGSQRINRFHLQDHSLVDDQVKTVSRVEASAFLDERQGDLAANP